MSVRANKWRKGDILLRFRTNSSDYKIAYQSNRLSDYAEQLSDLTYLAEERVLLLSIACTQAGISLLYQTEEWVRDFVGSGGKEYLTQQIPCLKSQVAGRRIRWSISTATKVSRTSWPRSSKIRWVHGQQIWTHSVTHHLARCILP